MLELDPNKAGFCGCDDLPVKTPLMSIDAAMALITASTQPVGQFETIPLAASVGRVLAQDVLARGDNPPFDNAAVDGYAVRSDAFEGQGPWVLQVTERVAAGEAPHHPLCGLQAARIFTGAPVPMGADAVVMQENTEIKDGALILSHPVRCGDHLRHRAEDMAVGACVVPSGTRLAPQHIAAIASAGWAEVRVASRLRIGLLVTGSEIHEAGQDIGGGQSGAIWDSNTPMLQASLDPANTVLTDIERVPDTHEAVQAAFARLAGRVDLIVTTGGISVGEEDHVKPALVRQGGQIGFSGVAVKPGKPVSFGTLGPTYWLGLPGNPQAAFVMWHLFGTLLIDRMLGAVCAVPKRQMAVLASDLHHKPGRCELRLAHHTGHDGLGRQTIQSETGTHSGRVGVLAQATGVILIPAETRHLPAGALVDYHPLSCL